MSSPPPSRSPLPALPDRPTLAHVLEQILADAGLTARQRQDIASALRTCAKALGRPLDDIPAHPQFIRERLKNFAPAMAGLTEPRWRNSKVIGPYDAGTISALKGEVDGDLYVSGSVTLVRAMLEDGLVDGLHLFTYPLTRGAGPRLFPETAGARSFELVACESYDNGVVYLAYR